MPRRWYPQSLADSGHKARKAKVKKWNIVDNRCQLCYGAVGTAAHRLKCPYTTPSTGLVSTRTLWWPTGSNSKGPAATAGRVWELVWDCHRLQRMALRVIQELRSSRRTTTGVSVVGSFLLNLQVRMLVSGVVVHCWCCCGELSSVYCYV